MSSDVCRCGCGHRPPAGRNYYRGHRYGKLLRRRCLFYKCRKMFTPLMSSQKCCSRSCGALNRGKDLSRAARKGGRSPKRQAKRDAMVAASVIDLSPVQAYRLGQQRARLQSWRSGYRAALKAVAAREPNVLRWANVVGLDGVTAWVQEGA
jgi:hypothetical protein